MTGGGPLVAGATSDAGRSVVTAGVCRRLARRGLKVAPFEAQNMSLSSFVTRDGAGIGRVQATQAAAARGKPTAPTNPVPLRPGGDGAYPESVGLTVWGTSRTRTRIGDITEIPALPNRPVWDDASRRMPGSEDEIGMPQRPHHHSDDGGGHHPHHPHHGDHVHAH